MARGDGRGGNHGESGNGDHPAHDIGPADILLGRLILLAREGNWQAVREGLEQVGEDAYRAEVVLVRASQCVRAGALQSAIKILDREFIKRFGEGGMDLVRPMQEKAPGGRYLKPNPRNMPIAQLGLPTRIVNAIENVFDAIYVDQLCKFSASDLCERRPGRGNSIGPDGVGKIRKSLAAIGCSLRGERVGGVSSGDGDGGDSEGDVESNDDSDEI